MFDISIFYLLQDDYTYIYIYIDVDELNWRHYDVTGMWLVGFKNRLKNQVSGLIIKLYPHR